jgi:hypothetical protein
MARMDVARKHKDLLRELQEERAAALRRISLRLERLLEELRDSRERVASSNGPERAGELATYRTLHAQATKYRWYLEVQREALGLRAHEVLDEFYRVPREDFHDSAE